MLAVVDYHLVAVLGGKPDKPKPLERPGVTAGDDGARRTGTAIPLAQLLKRLPGIEGEKMSGNGKGASE